MHIHSTMESVYKTFPMECLPREYLPDDYTGPCAGTVNDIAGKGLQVMEKNNLYINHMIYFICQ